MEYSPPPLFKQGPSALARLIFFVALAIALLVSDARFSTLEIVRGILGTALFPLQRAALVPRDLFMGAADLAATNASLRHDNQQLRERNLALSLQANQAGQLMSDNAHLRAVLGLRARIAAQSTPVEIQYDTSDPFSQKVVIGHGSHDDIQNGAPVVTEDGVVGQVTRVFPLQSEITLITDRDLAIPVQVLRTGLRSVIYGTPKGDSLDLRFVPTSADLMVGDELVTSGLDGTYPPGLPVAKVVRIDKLADTAFAHVVCMPVAAVRGAREMLVLHYQNDVPPRPVDPDADKNAKGKKGAKAADKGKGAAPAAAGEKPAATAQAPAQAAPAAKNGRPAPAAKPAATTQPAPQATQQAPAAAPSRGTQP
ncbi:rod shape-determining protein MreC [Burkholderia gladioli]|jgi:rod shape-determining protein MreC|uniref:rod shape-determining protein MreC n=1 Tax=Burkholderia gladioli TaxID=28095 RepID=UPI000CFE92D7|nr:rod shape-determining protein MreC [Burkholderia gladioli]MBU9645960.1 rod shape-determining protein MreC [Burkholderia gladioli]PRG44043.1 rod shape-determining protein MreC [Burkholderia gladioli]PRG98381.1 rod shape-determining protein MreC [Burkholderia gladioli]PRH26747.1 rod shape-determining protein MreC [Burkholderia gladioli]